MPRILIAEDNPHMITIAKLKLENAGYTVGVHETGPKALAAIKRNPPDLAILDWMLPAMTGIEILDSLRDAPKTLKLPAIMLTSLDKKTDKQKAGALNVVQYVTKSYRPDYLLSLVQGIVPIKR